MDGEDGVEAFADLINHIVEGPFGYMLWLRSEDYSQLLRYQADELTRMKLAVLHWPSGS